MDRAQLVLVALPILLFCRDIFNLFTPRPPKPTQYHYHQIVDPDEPDPDPQPEQQQILQEPLKFPVQQKSDGIGETGIGSTINIDFCTSCSYRGNAITMKNMLATSYPGITVILANHPASFSKRLLSKLVPVVQVGIIGTILGGEQIFQRMGMVPPPSWYESLKANRFGSIASSWLLGNFLQSYLHSTGAFEVFCNGELVFSKLKEERFPSEIELRDLVGKKLANLRKTPKADIK
ncbi:selT-like protein isoform X1 [Rosa chinensis]|uniref:selT-like protein isoform X1 n=1 Tax=Rosa chinensis TaxID=74649 RepID=UPI000D08EB89|nr:selT-like protein isoform X1 [Rosa chinensis]